MGKTLDLRARCARPRCNALIRKNRMAQESYERYTPYCSYHCQETHNMELAMDYVRRFREIGK